MAERTVPPLVSGDRLNRRDERRGHFSGAHAAAESIARTAAEHIPLVGSEISREFFTRQRDRDTGHATDPRRLPPEPGPVGMLRDAVAGTDNSARIRARVEREEWVRKQRRRRERSEAHP